MSNNHNTNTNEPRDKPSFRFTVDPHLEDIYTKEQFGLVLVAAWPPPTNQLLVESYKKFVSQVKQCFDAVDLDCEHIKFPRRVTSSERKEDGEEEQRKLIQEYDVNSSSQLEVRHVPNVYIYPHQHLHITIATFHPFHKSSSDIIDSTNSRSSENDESYAKICEQIVENAKKREDWPKQKIYMEIDKTQIGEKAGILLWKGCTNRDQESFYLMRSIIKEEYDKVIETYNKGRRSAAEKREIQIPNIIHSTFLRFGGHPQTDGKVIQGRFKTMVQEKIKSIFNNKEQNLLCIDTVKLVVEKRAYMHIPCNDEYVLKSIDMI